MQSISSWFMYHCLVFLFLYTMIRSRIIRRKGLYFFFFFFPSFFSIDSHEKFCGNRATVTFRARDKGSSVFCGNERGKSPSPFPPKSLFCVVLGKQRNLKGSEWLFIFSPPCLQKDWEFHWSARLRDEYSRIIAFLVYAHSSLITCPLQWEKEPLH